MRLTNRLPRSRQTGFSLVELMVGMAIGLLATIIIIQVMSVFDAQRRTTTGSADAQTNGGIALFSISRELKMAGYPLLPLESSALECTTFNINAGATGISGITPVTIADGVATGTISASDRITMRYGDSMLGGAITQTAGSVSGSAVAVSSTFGCQVNDISLIIAGGICNMSRVTALGTAPVSVSLTDTAGGGTPQANLACLGSWTEVTYAVNPATGNLDRTVSVNGAAAVTTPSVVGVVNLQAQYGVSNAPNENQVTKWVDAKVDADGNDWANPTLNLRNRIKAVRIAVVARNAKVEGEVVAAACSSLTAAAPAGLCAWPGTVTADGTTWPAPEIDLSPGDANWARYRYRVYETIIPLRNVIWSRNVL
jgi:type IV pilus assembly protein PilW